MPAGVGASYRSLGGDLGEDVYRSTTIVEQGHQNTTGHSVLESVKKAFSFAAPRVSELGGLRKKDPLIYEDRRESVSIVSRYLFFRTPVLGEFSPPTSFLGASFLIFLNARLISRVFVATHSSVNRCYSLHENIATNGLFTRGRLYCFISTNFCSSVH